jgi:hypothetical protein
VKDYGLFTKSVVVSEVTGVVFDTVGIYLSVRFVFLG